LNALGHHASSFNASPRCENRKSLTQGRPYRSCKVIRYVATSHFEVRF
jgi:hypothetical protein